jgi:hypothetical protein
LIRRHNTARGTPSIFNAVVQCSSRPLVEVAPVSFVEFERGFVTQPRAATKLPRQGAQVRAHGHRRLALRVMAIPTRSLAPVSRFFARKGQEGTCAS